MNISKNNKSTKNCNDVNIAYKAFTERLNTDPTIPESVKEYFNEVKSGRKLISLTSDAMAKRIFSPDLHPERFNFLMQRTMKDSALEVDRSATNELPMDNEESKKLIFDIAAWLKDKRYSDLEFQVVAQEFFFTRFDIHTSRILLFQYSAEKGKKADINYKNVPGVILVALMKESPKIFQENNSNNYIHRVTSAISDTGIEFPLIRQVAFVQLDKALELFLNKTYNEDEDLDLLALYAMIADINNTQVLEQIKGNSLYDGIFENAVEFSLDKEVQMMTFEDELAIMDKNTWIAEAKEEGSAETEKYVNRVYSWLSSNGRTSDVIKAFTDEKYRKNLYKEYDTYISSQHNNQ